MGSIWSILGRATCPPPKNLRFFDSPQEGGVIGGGPALAEHRWGSRALYHSPLLGGVEKPKVFRRGVRLFALACTFPT